MDREVDRFVEDADFDCFDFEPLHFFFFGSFATPENGESSNSNTPSKVVDWILEKSLAIMATPTFDLFGGISKEGTGGEPAVAPPAVKFTWRMLMPMP